ncbi:hypothetical protein AMTRI_Chr07g78730 [Amborella trichopoda]
MDWMVRSYTNQTSQFTGLICIFSASVSCWSRTTGLISVATSPLSDQLVQSELDNNDRNSIFCSITMQQWPSSCQPLCPLTKLLANQSIFYFSPFQYSKEKNKKKKKKRHRDIYIKM